MKLTAYEKKVSITFGVAFILMIVSSLLMLNGCGASKADDKSDVVETASDQAASESAVEETATEGLESLEYDPAMSSMPGFPIIVFWDEPENYEDEVKLTCSQGELIKWNQKTGKTKDLGKTHAYKKDEDIYWSPMEGQSIKDSTTIIATRHKAAVYGKIENLSDKGTYKARKV